MIDDECAICTYLQDSLNSLKAIGDFIMLTCQDKTNKKDFGLYLGGERGIQGTMNAIKNLIRYHARYHNSSEDESLIDDDFGIQSTPTRRPRRWRPPRRK